MQVLSQGWRLWNSLPHLCLFILKGNFKGHWISQRRRDDACVICQRWWGPRGHGTALPDGGSLGWKPEDGRRASKAQPRSTTSGFLPGVFTGQQECEQCIRDPGKWSPRQMQANHRDLPTETRGDGKLESGRIWDLCSSSNPKKKEGEAFPICYKTQGNMSRTLEERWPRRKHTRWGWHCGLGTTVLDVLLVFSHQVYVRHFSDSMGCSPSGSSVCGIFQGRVLEYVEISFSRGSSWSRDRTHVSRIAGRFFTTESPETPCLRVEPLRNRMMPLFGSETYLFPVGVMRWTCRADNCLKDCSVCFLCKAKLSNI